MFGVLVWWVALALAAIIAGPVLAQRWQGWQWAFAAGAMWGGIVLLVVNGFGTPLHVSRPPVLAAGFALLMTLLGCGSYWATIQLYPIYRVSIERAAWFVSVCTLVAMFFAVVTVRLL